MIQTVDGPNTVALRREILHLPLADDRIAVITCKRPDAASARGAVLLVHGFAQNRFSWHLPQRSFANYLVSRGLLVLNCELPGHGRSREAGSAPAVSFDDYVTDLPAIVRSLCESSGVSQVFGIGHSLGAAKLFAAAPTIGNGLAGLVSIAGLYRVSFGMLGLLDRVAGIGSRLGGLAGFPDWKLGLPVDHLGKVLLGGIRFFDSRLNKLPFMPWRAGSAEREVIDGRVREGFDKVNAGVAHDIFDWAGKGRFTSRDGTIDYAARFAELQDLPLLVITGDSDPLSAPEQSRAAYEESRSRDKTYRNFSEAEHGVPFGHIDLICGDAAPRLVWPEIADWIEARLV